MRSIKNPEIELGTLVCEWLRKKYYPGKSWSQGCTNKVARLYSKLKETVKSLYPDDKEIDLLRRLNKFDHATFDDICDMAKLDGLKNKLNDDSPIALE